MPEDCKSAIEDMIKQKSQASLEPEDDISECSAPEEQEESDEEEKTPKNRQPQTLNTLNKGGTVREAKNDCMGSTVGTLTQGTLHCGEDTVTERRRKLRGWLQRARARN